MTSLKELMRRNVLRIGIAYLVVAWILIQIVNNVAAPLNLPHWTPTFMIVLLGVGFPIALIIAWAFELTPEGVRRTSGAQESSDDNAAAQSPVTPIPAQAIEPPRSSVLPNSVAVLPFQNLSPKAEDAYFAAGLHEEVLNRLAKITALSVIARTSVARYANGTKPVPEIARELNVQTVMEGSVRFAGDRVRVTTQLIDGATDMHLWSETYERALGDVFAIETDIAMNVAKALSAKLSPKEQARIEEAPTSSPEAYALFLQAVAAGTEGRSESGLPLLRRTIEIDPQFAKAYGAIALFLGLASANSTVGNAVAPDERADLEVLSRKNAERAIELDPDVVYAHTALAQPAVSKWRWSEANKEFARALEAAPNDELARGIYGFLLSWTGRHDEAIAIAKRAVELNPNDPNAGFYGVQLGYARRYTDAVEVLERTLAVQPTNLLARHWLAFMEIAGGDSAAAVKQLGLLERLAGANPPVVFLPEWAYSYGRAGRREDAERLVEETKRVAENGALPGAGGWAATSLAIGDEKQALHWLDEAAKKAANHEPDEGLYALMNLRMNVTEDPVLRKSEFVEALSRIRGD